MMTLARRRAPALAVAAMLVAGCQTARPPDLVRCTLLVPRVHGDGSPVTAAEISAIEDDLFERFGGFTDAGEVVGAYRSRSGARVNDRSRSLWIAIDPARIPGLRRVVIDIGRRLGQESMYFEMPDGRVELTPTADDSVN